MGPHMGLMTSHMLMFRGHIQRHTCALAVITITGSLNLQIGRASIKIQLQRLPTHGDGDSIEKVII